jgi:hypothetical protein
VQRLVFLLDRLPDNNDFPFVSECVPDFWGELKLQIEKLGAHVVEEFAQRQNRPVALLAAAKV